MIVTDAQGVAEVAANIAANPGVAMFAAYAAASTYAENTATSLILDAVERHVAGKADLVDGYHLAEHVGSREITTAERRALFDVIVDAECDNRAGRIGSAEAALVMTLALSILTTGVEVGA